MQQRPSDILDLFQGRTKKESDLQQDSNRVNNTVIIPGQGGANAPIETESASGVGNYAPPVLVQIHPIRMFYILLFSIILVG